jgi:hypothetical protein
MSVGQRAVIHMDRAPATVGCGPAYGTGSIEGGQLTSRRMRSLGSVMHKERAMVMDPKALIQTVILSLLLAAPTGSWADGEGSSSHGDLAKASQNPVAKLVSVPFENNATFNNGPQDAFVNILNVKPVFPMSLTQNWNLIHRVILPVIYQDEGFSGQWVKINVGHITFEKKVGKEGKVFGLGDTVYQGFFSPAKPGKIIWGLGPQLNIPTGMDRLTANQWSLGPTGVVLTMPGPWVIGVLVSNVWSIGGYDNASNVNELTAQYFVNYNMKGGWYLSTAPVITANWEAEDSDDTWTVPFGGGFGRVFKIGKQHLKMSLAGYYSAIKPANASDWNMQFSCTFLFPK